MTATSLSETNQRLLYIILRIIVGIIFIWASWNKIFDPEAFSAIIDNYKILPRIFINPVAIILPWIELVCGLLLITNFLTKGSVLIVNFFLIVFVIAFVINLYRGVDISCGCFTLSVNAKKDLYGYIIRDLILLGAGLWILYYKIYKDVK